jgi:hypothetical protein
LNIPKKIEQNQTKLFDRDKSKAQQSTVTTSNGNYSVPNSLSDFNKNLNLVKNIKNPVSNSSKNNLSDNIRNIDSNQFINETSMETYFSTTNFTNITAQVGSIVEIPCGVHNLGNETVSKRILLILIIRLRLKFRRNDFATIESHRENSCMTRKIKGKE